MSGGDSSEGELIGLFEAVAIEVGLIIGGALFALVGVGVGVAGAGVVVAFALAITIAVLGLVPTALLGATLPTTCGHYRYPKRFVSPALAFVAAWGLGVSMFTGGLPLYALTAGEYLSALVPVAPQVSGVALLTLFFVVNLFGIRPAAWAQILMFLGLLGALGSFLIFGIPAVEGANLRPLFGAGPVNIVAGAGILYFACLGANFVIDLGGDVRNATLTIPQSFLVSIPLVFGIYVAVSVVAVGTVGVEAMAGETLAVPAERVLSPTFQTLFVVGGAVFAVATSLNAAFIIVPRYARVLAEDGLFPAALGARNDRYGTAHWALLGTYLLSVLLVFAPLPFEDMGALLGLGGAFVVGVLMLAVVAGLRAPAPEFDASAFPVPTRLVVWMAALAAPLNLVLIVLLATQTGLLFLGWLGAVVAGLGYYGVRTNYYASAGTSSREHT